MGPAWFETFKKGRKFGDRFLSCVDHIEAPCCNRGFYPNARRDIFTKLNPMLERHFGNKKGFVLVGAGLSSKLIMRDVAKGTAGSEAFKHTFIDVGSSFDIFAQKLSRDYISAKRIGGPKGWCAVYGDLLPPPLCKAVWVQLAKLRE